MVSGPGILPQSNDTWIQYVQTSQEYLVSIFQKQLLDSSILVYPPPAFFFFLNFASLIAQLVNNPPAMQETLVQFLGQEDPLEKG